MTINRYEMAFAFWALVVSAAFIFAFIAGLFYLIEWLL